MERNYEVMVLVKPILGEEERTKLQKKFSDIVKKAGGSVVSTDVWGKKYLAYPIQKFNEGYYFVYQLTLNSEKIVEFQQQLGYEAEILRYLVSATN